MRLRFTSILSLVFFITSIVTITLGVRTEDIMMVALGGIVFSEGLFLEMLLMSVDIKKLKDVVKQGKVE